MRKELVHIVLLLMLAMCACGCADKFKQIKFTSFALASVSPSGLRAMDAVVELGIDNPAPSFNLRDIRGDLMKDTVNVAHFTAEDVAIAGKTSKVYRVPMRGSVGKGLSLLDLAYLARSTDISQYTVNLYARAYIGEIGKDLAFEGIPLESLMNSKE